MDTTASKPKPLNSEPGPAYPGAVWRAPYAVDPTRTRGRLHPEAESETRTPFQRDRDRIIHSTAFRRLKQKTQVFVAHEGDQFRTRLTHSLEVSQIARSIARELGLDEELAESLALAHDLGHPPFGHAGEAALAACMADFGGFDHNAQTLRVVTKLEARYAEFDGLNLAWETLEGLVKHNGPVTAAGGDESTLPWALTDYEGWRGLEISTFAYMEAQVAALSDDIAYNNHDIDDGLRVGLFSIDDLADIPVVGETFAKVRAAYPNAERSRTIHESIRRLIGTMIADLMAETRANLATHKPQSADEVRALGVPIVTCSNVMLGDASPLRSFLRANMYRHYRVNRMMNRAKKIVDDLFQAFVNDPAVLPTAWQAVADGPGDAATARAACDYIAGMSDSIAVQEHRRLFGFESFP